jgi:integral membrane protein (TIGR00529 family)
MFAVESLLIKLIPFLKVLFAFVIMLAGMRFKVGLGLSIMTGGVVLGLIFGMSPLPIAQTGVLALTQEKFLFLAAIVGLILVLSDAMERSGQSARLMESLSGYLTSPRLRLIFFPALIGLLPMPGGAVFSAPMVKTVSEGMSIKNSDRAVLNYWFRHVWELCWPLYPGIILTVSLADIPIIDLISKSWPGTPVMLLAGWFFFLRPGVLGAKDITIPTLPVTRSKRIVLRQGLPLLVAIGGAIGLETAISVFAPAIAFEWGVVVALALGVACVMAQNTQLGTAFLRQVLAKKGLWSMLFVIVSIFVFKDVMQACGVVDEMSRVAGGDAALIASATFLPFLVGMVAGINVAFVGATFPLLLGVLNTLGMQDQTIPYLVLATFCGFTGVMISPIHICFVLTCQYFNCEIGRTWRKLVGPCLVFLLSGFGVFWFLQSVLG